MKKSLTFMLSAGLVTVLAAGSGVGAAQNDGWIKISDGKSFNGWKASENTGSWKIEDGAFVTGGERSHLYYVGEHQPFKDFEVKVEVMTEPQSNGGIYFHTQYQETGWPKHGYECQVNNSGGDPQKTGGLYDVVRVTEAPAPDNKWYEQHIIVKGRRIVVNIDGKKVVDFTEEPDRKPGADFTRILSSGTIAFQCHDPKSVVRYRNVRIRKL